MDSLVYKAIYRMENVYAEGYIILKNGFTECIFANDYMAIYKENNVIVADLKALTLNLLPNDMYTTSYTKYHFNMSGKELTPGKSHYFFSIIDSNTLCLDILDETVEGDFAFYLSEILLPKLREISSN